MAKKLKVTQVRSTIGMLEDQKRTVRALGLKKIRKSIVHDDTPSVRGMIKKVIHLVQVEEVDGE
ncbi:MAG: 50S ribosomal protein L30 [Fibrobacter sp.]|nr:50S ribosomal protein L30 [Fibrobacter sp.]